MGFPIKFLGLSLFFPVASTLISNSKNHLNLDTISDSELNKKFKSLKTLKKVILSPEIDPNISLVKNAPSIYSLFSLNLKTFSESFNKYFSQKIIQKWATKLLSSTEDNSFFNIKNKIKTIVSNSDNTSISSSFESLKSEFNDLFLNDLYKNNNLDKYGDPRYISSVKKFQDFLYKYWQNYQNPVLLCKKSWNFSPNSPTLYNIDEPPSQTSYEYPEFETSVASNIKTFYESNACNENSLFTKDDLTKISDSREISAFLELFLGNKYTKLVEVNNDGITITKPWDIFIIQDSGKDSLIEINKEILKDSKELKEHVKDNKKKYYLVDVRKVKFPSNQQTFGTFVKSPSGVTFLTVKTVADWNEAKDLPENFKLMDVLKTFFWKESSKILGSFYRENQSDFFTLFKTLNDDISEFELFKYTTQFIEILEENKKLFILTSTLSSTSNKYLNNNSPKGLEIPLYEKRNLDNVTEIKSEFSKEELLKNNGLFSNLNEYFEFKDPTLLSETAKQIKKPLALAISNLNVYSKEDRWFFNDYVFDNVLSDFSNRKDLILNTQKSIFLLNDLKFNHVNHNISNIFSSHFQNSISEIFIWRQYNSESSDVKANYGGWKNTQKNEQNCYLSRNKSNPQNNSCNHLKENNNQFLNRLNNYWLMKNYVFNEYGYEVGSIEFFRYLQHLFSINYLSKNNFFKLREYISANIPKNEFGVLVWINSIENIEDKDNKDNTGKEENLQLKNKTNYFQIPQSSSIFSKWLNPTFTTWSTPNPKQSSDLPSAYAKIENEEYLLFHGFKGLVTSKSNTDLKSIFSNWDKYVINTKNYASSSQEVTTPGSAFGIYLGEDGLSMENLVDSFDSVSDIRSFLKSYFKDEHSSLLSSLSEIESSGDGTDIDLQITKKEAKAKLKAIDKSKLRTLLSRFSGFIKNPNASESIHKNKPYFIPLNESGKSSDKGSIIYVTQVNRYDMGAGFSKFVNDITPLTLIKLLTYLSSDPSISNKFVSEFVSSRYVV